MSIIATEEEMDFSEELLGVVISRWTKMSSIMIANLRGSFLLRNGSISRKEDKWQLKVEAAPYDMLLKSLP